MEENQNSFEQIEKNIEEQDKSSKKSGLGFKMGLILIIVGVIIFLPILVFLFQKYENYTLIQKDKIFQERLRQAQQEEYEKAMADTYGGKTPAETLQMYIEAVEKGDYELASKYFIEGNRKREYERLISVKNNGGDFKEYVSILKKAKPWDFGKGFLVEFSSEELNEKNELIMASKTDLGPLMFVRLRKYPNGIWKIIEI
jgi:hypothetical protein